MPLAAEPAAIRLWELNSPLPPSGPCSHGTGNRTIVALGAVRGSPQPGAAPRLAMTTRQRPVVRSRSVTVAASREPPDALPSPWRRGQQPGQAEQDQPSHDQREGDSPVSGD